MKRLLKILAAVLAVTAVFVGATVYRLSEMRLTKTYDVPAPEFSVKALLSPNEIERRARTFMCGGCHHDAGNILFEAPGVGRVVAPNITRIARSYTDAELVRLLRHGVKKDGTGAMIMPSASFANISDEDIAAIVAWVRTLKERPDAVPGGTEIGPVGRVLLAAGQVPYSADRIPAITPPAARPADVGEYYFKSACSDCHSLDSDKPVAGQIAPALRPMAQSYPPDAFKALLRTGRGIGDRDLGLMTEVSTWDFKHLEDTEIEQIQAYLAREP